MGWVIGIAIALGALYVALLVLGHFLRAIAEATGASFQATSKAFSGANLWIVRRVGRATHAGRIEEEFEPEIAVPLSEVLSNSEIEAAARQYRVQTPLVQPPGIPVPTFPSVPDVLKVPEIQFSTATASALSDHHIPTLLNGRSSGCSIPATLDKAAMSNRLHVPTWTPPNAFPNRPLPTPSIPLTKATVTLRLPLYGAKAQGSRVRKWLVNKLNEVVRVVHAERIRAFHEDKARVQQEHDNVAKKNAMSDSRFKCELAAWELVKEEAMSEREKAAAAFLVRTADAERLYVSRKTSYELAFEDASIRLSDFWERIRRREGSAVIRLFDIALARIIAPAAIPREWVLEYDTEHGILVVDVRLPDFERIGITRQVALKREVKVKPVSAKEHKQFAELASCLYVLRVLHEVVHHDQYDVVKAVTLNGWVEFVDATTGQDRSVVILSLFAEKKALLGIDIARVDAVKCIGSLGGRFAGIQHGYVGIAPIVRLNRHDDRVIEGSDVISDLAVGTNLAGMDWDKFEHLIRQLFEKVFAGPDIEVKVTRASRDRGVDAIIFDPDPIKGGKTVIQAKRYVNTVDLSAVRDLYGTVVNEGANKGILVTTSSFGPDAYEFAKDKNLTLLSGRELLGLLERHGYQYRIDLEEARRLHIANRDVQITS